MHICFKDTMSITGFSQGHVYPNTTELVEYVHKLRKCKVAKEQHIVLSHACL